MQSRDTGAGAKPRRSTRTLWLILAICAAPMIGSYVAYYVWRPAAQVNYGDLIEPRPLPDSGLMLADGRPFRWADYKGEWLLVTADRAACDERCRLKFTYMRQVRLAQGKETQRIERVWLVTDDGAPEPSLIAEHPGLRVVQAAKSTTVKSLPLAGSAPGSVAAHIYIVDPLGNLMMRFPAEPDPRRMLKDVARLLRHSKWK